jgi:hypothetical protein
VFLMAILGGARQTQTPGRPGQHSGSQGPIQTRFAPHFALLIAMALILGLLVASLALVIFRLLKT